MGRFVAFSFVTDTACVAADVLRALSSRGVLCVGVAGRERDQLCIGGVGLESWAASVQGRLKGERHCDLLAGDRDYLAAIARGLRRRRVDGSQLSPGEVLDGTLTRMLAPALSVECGEALAAWNRAHPRATVCVCCALGLRRSGVPVGDVYRECREDGRGGLVPVPVVSVSIDSAPDELHSTVMLHSQSQLFLQNGIDAVETSISAEDANANLDALVALARVLWDVPGRIAGSEQVRLDGAPFQRESERVHGAFEAAGMRTRRES